MREDFAPQIVRGAWSENLEKSTFIAPLVTFVQNKKKSCLLTSAPPFHHALSLLSFAPPALVNAPVPSTAGEFMLALHPVRLLGVSRYLLEDRSGDEGIYIYIHHYIHLVPAPSETCWFRGMSVGGSFRRV